MVLLARTPLDFNLSAQLTPLCAQGLWHPSPDVWLHHWSAGPGNSPGANSFSWVQRKLDSFYETGRSAASSTSVPEFWKECQMKAILKLEGNGGKPYWNLNLLKAVGGWGVSHLGTSCSLEPPSMRFKASVHWPRAASALDRTSRSLSPPLPSSGCGSQAAHVTLLAQVYQI